MIQIANNAIINNLAINLLAKMFESGCGFETLIITVAAENVAGPKRAAAVRCLPGTISAVFPVTIIPACIVATHGLCLWSKLHEEQETKKGPNCTTHNRHHLVWIMVVLFQRLPANKIQSFPNTLSLFLY